MHKQAKITYILWILLIGVSTWAALSATWHVLFPSSLTLLLSFSPIFFERKTKVKLPTGFIAAVVIFMFGTLFLGEVGNFYERFWWWGIVLHTGSAVAFGLIGAIWEIFEFSMDQFFGLNMQKSGLVDTMFDLIVDCIGAFVGAISGYAYLKGKENGFFSKMITEFVGLNNKLFNKSNKD